MDHLRRSPTIQLHFSEVLRLRPSIARYRHIKEDRHIREEGMWSKTRTRTTVVFTFIFCCQQGFSHVQGLQSQFLEWSQQIPQSPGVSPFSGGGATSLPKTISEFSFFRAA